MSYTLESFISYCDDMMITNEGLKELGKSIWDTLIRIFRKLVAWFKNLLLNINYFKNAYLPDQMNKDLLNILHVSQARTEALFKVIPLVYNQLTLQGNRPDSDSKIDGAKFAVAGDNVTVSRDTTLTDQIHRVSLDVTENVNAAKETQSYQRFKENNYTDDKKLIPLSNIIPDMKKSTSNLATFQNHLEKFKAASEKHSDNPKSVSLLKNMATCMNHIVTYYNFRISILSPYFSAAKASITGTINNFKEKKNGENQSKNNFKHNIKVSIKHISDVETRDKIKKVFEEAHRAETYQKYKPLYDELCSLLSIKNAAIHKIMINNSGQVTVQYAEERDNQVAISSGQKLYHTSPKAGITQLEPRWRTPAVLWSTPRVYFHMNTPLDRFSNRADSSSGGHVYVLKNNPSTVHVDKELGTTAVYVNTDRPLAVEEINYQELRNAKNIDLKLKE